MSRSLSPEGLGPPSSNIFLVCKPNICKGSTSNPDDIICEGLKTEDFCWQAQFVPAEEFQVQGEAVPDVQENTQTPATQEARGEGGVDGAEV